MRAAIVVAALALGACRARAPGYHRDVAPILARHCVECHRAGGIAPVPPLDGYASARMYAQPIRVAVQTRRMPPWGADDTGQCNTWVGARWLTSDEISTIVRWQEAGAPEGDPRPAPSPPSTVEEFRGDVVLALPRYRPGLGAGGNRCFVADPKLDRDRLLTAIRVTAGDPRGVAQVTLYDADAPDGECFGSPRGARPLASWSWPRPLLRLPGGIRLRAGRKLVAQIHYDITHTGDAFETAIRVELEFDDGARELQLLPISAGGALAPGQRFVTVENRHTVERRTRVYGVMPRMHIRGELLQLTVDGRCLASFDHWNFYNQRSFALETPFTVEKNDRVKISCAYNTLGRAQPVAFGDGIDDEECAAWLLTD